MFLVRVIKKYLLAVCLFSFLLKGGILFAQEAVERDDDAGAYLYTGGNFGIVIGTVDYVEIAPLVGYALTEEFAVGIGGVYSYFNVHQPNYRYSSHVYGARLFSRYMVVDPVFVYGEFGLMNMRRDDAWINTNGLRVTEEQVYAGVGYLEQLTEEVFVQTLVLYSVNEMTYYPLENIVFRVGFEIRLD